MNLNVPKEKDAKFAQNLFVLISDSLCELRDETDKWPDRIIFSGPLGKEVHSFIMEKGWDLAKFNPQAVAGGNIITFDYSKPLTQIEERGTTLFDESFNNRTMKGIPGPNTVQKIISTYSAPAFKIERQIRPKLEIFLTQKN